MRRSGRNRPPFAAPHPALRAADIPRPTPHRAQGGPRPTPLRALGGPRPTPLRAAGTPPRPAH
jgi:hypothetical protein